MTSALLAITLLSLLGIVLALAIAIWAFRDGRKSDKMARRALEDQIESRDMQAIYLRRADEAERERDYWHKLHDQLLGRRSRRQPETPAPAIAGIPLVTDPNLPPNEAQFRQHGKIVARMANVGSAPAPLPENAQ